MTREWKPGDVAMVEGRVMIAGDSGTWVDREGDSSTPWRPTAGLMQYPDDLIRPAVVIDPEDREQVERLRDLYDDACERQHGIVFRNTAPQRGNALQAALRSLIAPPKPPEPMGLGAVVEDSQGRRWVRVPVDDTDAEPWTATGSLRGGDCEQWSSVRAVRVLSEGVTS